MTMDALSQANLEKLQALLNRAATEASPCRYRGCQTQGEYYMRRQLRDGREQVGLYCDEHDELFGEENLHRAGKAVGGQVVWLMDFVGQFRGIQN